MKNKGFTLIELIASIAILAMLSTIIVVAVSKSVNKAKEEANEVMMKSIRLAAEDYAVNNEGILTDFSTNDWVYITIETLMKSNYFDNELKNSITKEDIPITDSIYITRSSSGKITSVYDENQNEEVKLLLNGPFNVYIKRGSSYTEQGVTATDKDGINVTGSVTTTGNVDTNTIGKYVVTYSYGNKEITRNVEVLTDVLVKTDWLKLIINYNDGGVTPGITYSLKEGRSQDIGANPTRANYVFNGWSRSCIDCLNTSTHIYTMGTSNDTLIAQWTASYTCSMDATPIYTCSSGTLTGTRCDLGAATVPNVTITSTWERLYISGTCDLNSCWYADCQSGTFTCSGSPSYTIGNTASAWVTATKYSCKCNCNMVGSCTVTWGCTTGTVDANRCYLPATLSSYTCPSGGTLSGTKCYLYNQSSCGSGWTVV
jgi:prepilin-type N-terminal cleavage/methylation domain-containing protein/uncharacterized repeat protein (TIGR02543 family)